MTAPFTAEQEGRVVLDSMAGPVVVAPSRIVGSVSIRAPRGHAGGKARAAKLTPAERSEVARKAATTRWSQREA